MDASETGLYITMLCITNFAVSILGFISCAVKFANSGCEIFLALFTGGTDICYLVMPVVTYLNPDTSKDTILKENKRKAGIPLNKQKER